MGRHWLPFIQCPLVANRKGTLVHLRLGILPMVRIGIITSMHRQLLFLDKDAQKGCWHEASTKLEQNFNNEMCISDFDMKRRVVLVAKVSVPPPPEGPGSWVIFIEQVFVDKMLKRWELVTRPNFVLLANISTLFECRHRTHTVWCRPNIEKFDYWNRV